MVVWRFVRRSRCGRKLHDMSVLPSVGNSQKSRCQRQRKNRLQQQLQALPRITQTQPASQPASQNPPPPPTPFKRRDFLQASRERKFPQSTCTRRRRKGEYHEKRPKSFRRCTTVHVRMYVCMYVREIPPTSQKAETTKTKDGKAKAKQVADSDVLPMHGIYIHNIIPSRWKKKT
jgi:hypothetical protein